jgi:hypothetical protein
MTWDERVDALQAMDMGWSARQAGFLVTVMLHAGVCLKRHYSTFARVPHGQNVQDLFESLVTRGVATARACGHNRARVYHIHYKPLYRAIGEVNNRHRKPTTVPRAVERMMVLDAVLADRDRTWLATEQDKLAFFTLTHRIPRQDLPSLTWRTADTETTRFFPDKLPVGLGADGRTHIFSYLLTRDTPRDFRAFLERHAELLRALPVWTLRLLVPRHKTAAIRVYQSAFREQLLTPLRPAVLDDLRWYFRARTKPPQGSDESFDQAARAFASPRFRVLFEAWQERGDAVLEATLSHVLADAVARGSGQLETYVLPHSYLRLLPLVGTA